MFDLTLAKGYVPVPHWLAADVLEEVMKKRGPGKWALLMYLYNEACYKEIYFEKYRRILKRGQYLCSYRELAEKLHLSKSAVERYVKALKNEGWLDCEVSGSGPRQISVLTIINYGKVEEVQQEAGADDGQVCKTVEVKCDTQPGTQSDTQCGTHPIDKEEQVEAEEQVKEEAEVEVEEKNPSVSEFGNSFSHSSHSSCSFLGKNEDSSSRGVEGSRERGLESIGSVLMRCLPRYAGEEKRKHTERTG